MRRILALVALFTSIFASAQIEPVGHGGPGPYKADHLTIELIAAQHEIAESGDGTLGLVFTLEDGWHVYWINAGDSGEAPSVEWTLPKGITADAMLFPAPSRLPLAPLMDYGYEDAVTFPVRIHATKKLKANKGIAHLAAKVNWLVCSSSRCLPGSANLGIDLKVVPEKEKERLHAATEAASKVGALGSAFNELPKLLPQGASAEAIATPEEIIVTLHNGQQEKDAEFYPFVQYQIVNAADQQIVPQRDGVTLRIQRSPDLKKLPATLHGLFKLDDERAYEIDVPLKQGSAPPLSVSKMPASSMGAWAAIGLAFLGGALLNLMPCVFPVLFLKALSLVRGSQAERKHALTHGAVYAIGIVVSFWVLLLALLGLRAGGSQLGWGFQMQSPGFVAVLAIGIFFFSLSLAGFFELGLSMTSMGGSLAQKEGYSGSFFTGVLATVVATPCTAPLMGPAIGFALTQSTLVTFAIFTSLALGLAAPYLLLAANPKWTSILPRPGAWMEILKQITAIPLFITVIWLVYLYASLFAPEQGIYNAALLLGALLIVAIAGWVLHRWPAGWKSTTIAIVIAAAAISVPFLFRATAETNTAWQPYSKESIHAARAQGRPVFVDFTAKWCLSCQVNERAVLNTTAVQKRFREHNVLLLKADWTRYDPQITAELAAVGRNGVPTYVIYPADETAKPDVLPEVLSKDGVISALDKDLK
ncbi:MAG: thioredoxin family protein [Acidobacteria bacterium]|nr:thioredoxin family protein [Acidobacteriota bacterium]